MGVPAPALALRGPQSAGRVATCFDISVAESFFSSLKRELAVTASRRDQRRSRRSPPGSSDTTSSGSIHRSATSRRSSGRSSTVIVSSKPHNHVSG